MSYKIIQYAGLPEDLQKRLEEHCQITRFESIDPGQGDDFRSALAEAEGLIGVSQDVGAPLLELAPKLRVASTISVGYDHFDVAEMTGRNVMLMHTPDVLTETTADMIFMLILCAARRGPELHQMVKQGGWSSAVGPEHFGTDVHGKTLGIFGLGRIGRAVARRAYHGFNMKILYYGRSANEEAEAEFQARRCSLDEILEQSDFVCLVLPLSDETHHLIGRDELAKMKPQSFLINGGRGSVVDEQALIEALENKIIRGAGLDVYEQEPLPAESALRKLDNVVVLPHIGSATRETRYAMAELAVENLLAALKSNSTRNCVNPPIKEET